MKWSNHTQEHPRGVCEAATSLWLNSIARGGQHGLSHANQLQPTDCDALQAQVEAGSGWTYSLNLRELLPANVTLHGSGDGFFVGIDSAMPNTIKGGQTNSTPSALLGTLQSGDFFYINASGFSGGNAGGHAMAVFYDGQQYHFFNPDTGIFHGTREQIAGYIESGVVNWRNVSVHQGHIPQA